MVTAEGEIVRWSRERELTVTTALADAPDGAATVINEVPGDMALTNPFPSTVATGSLLEADETLTLLSRSPAEFFQCMRAVAESQH